MTSGLADLLREHRNFAYLVLALILVSPLFGVILAEAVGYREPLDVAAEKLGLRDITEEINWTPFLDYTVPGLPDWLGYILSGFLGVAIILAIGLAYQRLAYRQARAEG